MKTTGRIILPIILLIPFGLRAQTDVDALRYSQTSIAGTARFTSMGGAFGALGGDFSTLSWNPAGIAIYRTSEFTFTPSLYMEKTNSDFLGNSANSSKYNFNFGNIGFVFTRKLSNDDNSYGWKNWNFGLGYNRLNNFHASTLYQGDNLPNSLLDHFLDNANAGSGLAPDKLDPFYENLAYQTYLINPDSTNFYTSVIPAGGETQRRSSITKGALSEFVVSFGANYSNRLYLGATLGFSSIRYIEETTYEEVDKNNSIFDFNNLRFNQNLNTHGYGINLKLGMIYRATDWLRAGLAFHTPTFYSMTDDYNNTMSSAFDNGDSYSFNSPQGTYDYNLTTPMRVIGSVAFIYEKTGLISADYEFVDYSEPRFDASDFNFFDVNDLIQKKYTGASNFKVGTEWKYQNISFRGGFAWYGTPFSDAYRISGADMSKTSYSLGIGVRDKDYFIDLGYVLSMYSELYVPYSLVQTGDPSRVVQAAKFDVRTNNFTVTLGAKF